MILLAGADGDAQGLLCRLARRRVPRVRVVCTSSGPEALDLLARAEYSVAMVDQDLICLSGTEVIRRARCRQIKTPMVLFASGATRVLALRARQVGAQDLLEKPVLVSQVDAVLSDFVGMRRLPEGT
jgi:CheY-like chemotaxis protein